MAEVGARLAPVVHLPHVGKSEIGWLEIRIEGLLVLLHTRSRIESTCAAYLDLLDEIGPEVLAIAE